MALLDELIANGKPVAASRPAPRAVVDAAIWQRAAQALQDAALTLLGLWGEPRCVVHMALLDPAAKAIAVLSLDCVGRRLSVGRPATSAGNPARAHDPRSLWAAAEGAPDLRPWLDHRGAYQFLPAHGEHLHQIPVGPVHAGIIEPGHFRFTANGETVVRLEQRLGYVHKGVEKLMEGAEPARAARLAGRVSGDSTVAYAMAFARAVEDALGCEVPQRAIWLRALMAELERVANHLGDIGAVCNDAAFALMLAHCGALRERVLRRTATAFGHRLMMDCVVPGGVAADLDADRHALRSAC